MYYIEQSEREEYQKRELCILENAGLDCKVLGETLTADFHPYFPFSKLLP